MLPVFSFDFGETLATIDHAFFAEKLRVRGVHVSATALRASAPAAWDVYNANPIPGDANDGEGHHPWKKLMCRIVELAGASQPELHVEVIHELFVDQRERNLWRQPIDGMIELVANLKACGARTAILSNSEGRMAELVEELGWTRHFDALVDSGRLAFAKPERAIFQVTADALGAGLADVVHIGDSLRADVEGARSAGARAIWFASPTSHVARPARPHEDVEVVETAAELRDLLRRDWRDGLHNI